MTSAPKTEKTPAIASPPRIYEGDGDRLVEVPQAGPKVTLLPSGDPRTASGASRIRVMWGQHLLDDLVEGHYRTLVLGVNDTDNTHGILREILKLVPTSQWTLASATSYAKMFRSAVDIHAREDREPYILKFDLDRILVLALLRPSGRDHFNLEDLYRGFKTVTQMLSGRADRAPVATISFLGAKSNRLRDHQSNEPSVEAVLKAMHHAGYRGDFYPPVSAWDAPRTGVFARYPFPEGVDRMREGSS
ncbi:MAG: hypothetical protein EXS15_07485 [Phycisphaerales bacterium]|nr:hypothetical protein [Phycisphaerales bacterium]